MVKIRKNIDQRINNLKNELIVLKKRIKDATLLSIQEKINKIKNIIDNEINRRAENLNKQEIKKE